jgi:hypothetical protein
MLETADAPLPGIASSKRRKGTTYAAYFLR